MKTIARIAAVGVLAAALSLGAAGPGYAQDKPGLGTTGSIADALGKLGDGRDVEIVLTNGKSYRGKLGSVGKDTVLVTQIAGKEFYDVLIALDEVAAVELRVRSN
jgi:hypothetical protein